MLATPPVAAAAYGDDVVPDPSDPDGPSTRVEPPDEREPVRLVSVDRRWAGIYRDVAEEVVEALGDAMRAHDGQLLEVHHVGSTAVHGLSAKPTLDLIGRLATWPLAEGAIAALLRRGFRTHGEHGLPGRHFLSRGGHDVHLHLVASDGDRLRRHLAFRDRLLDVASDRASYDERKRRLVARHGGDRVAYVAGKAAWVQEVTARAERDRLNRLGFAPVRELARRVALADAMPVALGSWAVGGGWALDLALGRPRRAHDDLDVVLERSTAQAWLNGIAVQDVAFRLRSGARAEPWRPVDGLPDGPCRVEARLGPLIAPSPVADDRTDVTATFWDLAVEARPADRWVLRTDPPVGRPVTEAFVEHRVVDAASVFTVPALAPEVALVCKARLSGRPPYDGKDDGDFDALLSTLDRGARVWLRAALVRPPVHPWSARLA